MFHRPDSGIIRRHASDWSTIAALKPLPAGTQARIGRWPSVPVATGNVLTGFCHCCRATSMPTGHAQGRRQLMEGFDVFINGAYHFVVRGIGLGKLRKAVLAIRNFTVA